MVAAGRQNNVAWGDAVIPARNERRPLRGKLIAPDIVDCSGACGGGDQPIGASEGGKNLGEVFADWFGREVEDTKVRRIGCGGLANRVQVASADRGELSPVAPIGEVNATDEQCLQVIDQVGTSCRVGMR